MTDPTRLAVVISGRGRNLEAIQNAVEAGQLNARIVGVFSNRDTAAGLVFAENAGLATHVVQRRDHASRHDYDAALAEAIAATEPDWVALAGFMRVLSAAFVDRFMGRLINIHPSLLPKYKGLDTHERVLAAGDRVHGASVHFVTAALDGGPVIRQGRIRVLSDDDATTLADRVMARVEQRLYPAVLTELIAGRVVFEQGAVWRNGQRQEHIPSDNYEPS